VYPTFAPTCRMRSCRRQRSLHKVSTEPIGEFDTSRSRFTGIKSCDPTGRDDHRRLNVRSICSGSEGHFALSELPRRSVTKR
jgi:hypothetical protein